MQGELFFFIIIIIVTKIRRVKAKEVSLWFGVFASALTYMLRTPTTVLLTHNQSFGIRVSPCFGFDFYRK